MFGVWKEIFYGAFQWITNVNLYLMIRYSILLSLILLSHFLRAQDSITLRIDPDNARGGTATQIFDSVRFIPLETTKESLFGSIDQLEVTDSFFIILDTRGHSILLFRRNGSFFTRISTGGGDKYFFYFTLDRSAGEIIVTNNFANALLVYDLQGRFLRNESFPGPIYSLYSFPGKTVLYNLHRSAKLESSDHILFDLCYSKGYDSVFKNVKPYNARNEGEEFTARSNFFNFSGEAGSCMFSLPFDYTFYQLNDTGILRKYHLVFPLIKSLPPNFSTDVGYRNMRLKYAYNSPGTLSTILQLERGFRYGDYLLFSTFTRHMVAGGDYNFAYNFHSGSVISFSRVTGDSSSFYFPILSNPLERIEAICSDIIFSSLPSFTMFAVKNGLDKRVDYPEELKKYFENGKRTDNSVIVQFRLKPNL